MDRNESAGASRSNNFDLLRLFAASQVVWFHTLDNLQIHDPAPVVSAALRLFPGVPIFFVISGYLISMSYERSRSVWQYGLNRFLRIYPALVLSFILTLVLLTLADVWDRIEISSAKLLQWAAMQLTVGQFYSPYVVKTAYSVGHTNGSLWTIPVELQFYVIVPVIYLVLRRFQIAAGNAIIVVLLVASYAFGSLWDPVNEDLQAIKKLSCITWIYMFFGGVLLQRNKEKLARLIDGKGMYWLVAYLTVASVGVQFGASLAPRVNIFLYPLLACTIVSLAHTRPRLSDLVLRRNDLSYGIYIYHMLIVNALYDAGYSVAVMLLPVVFVLSYLIAYASWRYMERPALRLKPSRPVQDPTHVAPGNAATPRAVTGIALPD